MSKTCTKCKVEKPYTDYHKDKYQKDGYRCSCKSCQQLVHIKRYEKDPEGQRARSQEYRKRIRETNPEKLFISNRKTKLKRAYNISLEDYDNLVMMQNNSCKICGKEPSTKLLAVDHSHMTGKVRGLLCGNCNTALGLIKDNTELLSKMITYLEEAA